MVLGLAPSFRSEVVDSSLRTRLLWWGGEVATLGASPRVLVVSAILKGHGLEEVYSDQESSWDCLPGLSILMGCVACCKGCKFANMSL